MKKMTQLAMFLAISIVLSILESFIPVIVPGAKLGLANVVILILLYRFGFREAVALLVMRIILVSLLLGSFMSITFYMSISGGAFAILSMYLVKKLKIFNLISVSVVGATMHSCGQIFIAILILAGGMIYYLPILVILSIITGVFTGFAAKEYLRITNNEEEVGD